MDLFRTWGSIPVLSVILFSHALHAGIQFTEVSSAAGVRAQVPTAAAAWGDINGDGWPDLWVSNHHLYRPSLYLNQGDGTFRDIAAEALPGDPRGDYHGAAWADFDNDGDQDLMVVTGGGGGRGRSPNHLFVNEEGILRDRARELGVDYPLGRGRTPLWLDADRDGRLDLLLMNRSRPDGQAPSAVFVQADRGFEARNEAMGFHSGRRSREERLRELLANVLDLRLRWDVGAMYVNFEFAQLADVSNDGSPDLIAFAQPVRMYAIDHSSLKGITAGIDFPKIDHIQDVAVEDLNGDGQVDLYLARALLPPSDVIQVSAQELRARLVTPQKAPTPKTLRFRTRGEVSFALYEPWREPSDPLNGRPLKLSIGSSQRELTGHDITLSPDDPVLNAPLPPASADGRGVAIAFDPDAGLWTLRSSLGSLNLVIRSRQPISEVQTPDFEPSDGGLPDRLLIRRGDALVAKALANPREKTPCQSVAWGDFDNDMDVDLYLVCSGPVTNAPNRLLENDGYGNFVPVSNAGGAQGSRLGRGNQVAVADYDRDGFLDLFVTNGAGPPPFSLDGPHQLYRNRGNANHWLEIDLRGSRSNRDGIGAKLVAEVHGRTLVRRQGGAMHSFSQDHQRIHFGLGPNTQVERLTIHWPSGAIQRLESVRADQILVVQEPSGRQVQTLAGHTNLPLR